MDDGRRADARTAFARILKFDPERPDEAKAKAYDIVWNGQELGGGSIRISDTAVQEQVFGVIGIGQDIVP